MRTTSLLARLALASALGVAASPADAALFVFKDWAVACDNTRGCEAAGFRAEDSDSRPVMLWISRDAGADTPVRARLKVETADGARTGPFRLVIDRKAHVDAPLDGDLDADAFEDALPGFMERPSVEVDYKGQRFTLSLNGPKAALLKMDDLQGRVGTVGALVHPGKKSERGVPPALPAFTPHPAPRFAVKSTDAALLKLVAPTLRGECDVALSDSVSGADVNIHRVSDSQVIVLRECRRDVESLYAAWLVDDKPPYAARRLDFPQADGTTPSLSPGTQWDDEGSLRSIGKRGGRDDCGSDAFWTWNGRALELYNAHEEPLCRGMLGGGMTLRTFAYALPQR